MWRVMFSGFIQLDAAAGHTGDTLRTRILPFFLYLTPAKPRYDLDIDS
jgi:hypothetical protein